MVKVITELEKLGLELTDEMKESIKKSIGEEVYSKGELDKKVKKAEEERDQYKERAETAEETLKGFDGKDLETITKERDEWKEKAETAKKDYDTKIAEREKNDLLEKAFESVKKNDASAFVDEQAQQQEQNQATFTNPMGAGAQTEPITGDPNKMDFATYKKWREQNQ